MLASVAGLGSRLHQRVASGSSWTAARFLSSASPSAPPTSSSTHYRITLRRSAIGLPEKTRLVLSSLGLRKRMQSVYRPRRADIAGMVLAVKELVHVENVKPLTAATTGEDEPVWVNEDNEVVDWGARRGHVAPRGYTVVGNVSNAIRNDEILSARRTEEKKER